MTCMEWRVTEHRRVVKWLRRQRNYLKAYRELWHAIARDPYKAGELLRGCGGLRKARKGELRVLYEIDARSCTVRIVAAGLRENIYEEYC